jgi:hypothetical protein
MQNGKLSIKQNTRAANATAVDRAEAPAEGNVIG